MRDGSTEPARIVGGELFRSVTVKDTPTICKKRVKSMNLEKTDYFSP